MGIPASLLTAAHATRTKARNIHTTNMHCHHITITKAIYSRHQCRITHTMARTPTFSRRTARFRPHPSPRIITHTTSLIHSLIHRHTTRSTANTQPHRRRISLQGLSQHHKADNNIRLRDR